MSLHVFTCVKMQGQQWADLACALRAYMEVLRLVRRLLRETRPYYAKYARENFVNYRKLDDSASLDELLQRAYTHTTWVLNKYSVDQSVADNLKEICCG